MEIAQEEVFGPVLCVISAATLDQAIEIVNSQPVRQRHLDLHRVRRLGPPLPPRGARPAWSGSTSASPRRWRSSRSRGWKDSFLGDLHAHGPDAVEFFTRKKTVTSRYFSSGQGSGGYFVER